MRDCSWAATGKLRNRLPRWPIRHHKIDPPPLIRPLFGNYGALVAASAVSCLNIRGPPAQTLLIFSLLLLFISFFTSLYFSPLPWVRIPHSFVGLCLSLLLPVTLFVHSILTLFDIYPCVPGLFSAVIPYPPELFYIHLLFGLPAYTKKQCSSRTPSSGSQR